MTRRGTRFWRSSGSFRTLTNLWTRHTFGRLQTFGLFRDVKINKYRSESLSWNRNREKYNCVEGTWEAPPGGALEPSVALFVANVESAVGSHTVHPALLHFGSFLALTMSRRFTSEQKVQSSVCSAPGLFKEINVFCVFGGLKVRRCRETFRVWFWRNFELEINKAWSSELMPKC